MYKGARRRNKCSIFKIMLHSKEYDHTIMYIYVAEIKLPQLVECIIYFKTA